MKPTDEQITQAAERQYKSIDQSQLGAMFMYAERKAYSKGAQWAISQMQPEWVSVTPDVKPEPGKYYFALVKTTNGNYFKCVATYTEGWDLEVDGEGDEDHLNHSEENEMSYMPKGWYECCEQQGGGYDEMYFKRDVVFYLPSIEIPQPPKENNK